MKDLPPLMQTTPGITEKRFTIDPLGTEGELTPGPDEINPYNSLAEKEEIEDYKTRLREDKSETPELVKVPFDAPTEDDFIFDDMGHLGDVQLPMLSDGPQF